MKMEEKLSFREAQLGAYEILKFLDELCRKHKFRYFLMYGSLIGAVRNKGIIPWDDDVDIMMPKKRAPVYILYNTVDTSQNTVIQSAVDGVKDILGHKEMVDLSNYKVLESLEDILK